MNFRGCQSPGVLLLSEEGEGASTWSSSFVDRVTAVQYLVVTRLLFLIFNKNILIN